MEEGLQSNADWDMTSAPTVLEPATCVTFRFYGRCHGRCDRSEAALKSFKVCEICVDVTLCDECSENHRPGLGRRLSEYAAQSILFLMSIRQEA
jgi:hypothetical protein